MPTTFRFLTILSFLVMAAYAVMLTLAALVEPRQTEMEIPISPERFDLQRDSGQL